jgi:hypothetical protein
MKSCESNQTCLRWKKQPIMRLIDDYDIHNYVIVYVE